MPTYSTNSRLKNKDDMPNQAFPVLSHRTNTARDAACPQPNPHLPWNLPPTPDAKPSPTHYHLAQALSSHRSLPFPVPRSLRAKLKPVERPCKPRLLRLNSEGCRAHALFAHHESRFTVPTHSSRYKVYVPARAKHVSLSYSADAGAQYRTCRWLLERAQEAASS